MMDLEVYCKAGQGSAPERLRIGARSIGVVEILDRWPGRDHRYFKLSADDGNTYVVRHDVPADRWTVTVFESEPLSGASDRNAPVRQQGGES